MSNVKILLIKLKEPIYETQKPCYVPPIGLWSMKSFVEHYSNHRIDICDEHMGDDTKTFLEKNKYDIVGISAQFSIQHKEYLRISKLIKIVKPGIKVIAGGFHASAIGKPVFVDEIIHGEGEEYFSNLLFNKGIQSFDNIPFPFFRKKELKKYWKLKKPHDLESKTNKWMTIETSRGCNKKCNFCGVPNFWGRWRGHSVDWLNDHFKYLMKHGIKELFIEDDNLTMNKKRFIEIVRYLKQYNLLWSTPNGIQANTLFNKEILNALGDSTCWKLSLPFEAGNKKSADLMNIGNKFMKFDDAKNLIKVLKSSGIKTVGFFVIGYPGETIYDVNKTLEYANALPLDGRHVHIAIPYPGTPIYDTCKEKDYLLYDGEELYEQLLCTHGLIKTNYISPEEIYDIKMKDREEAIERRKYGRY